MHNIPTATCADKSQFDFEKVDCTGCPASCCRSELVALIEGDDINDYPLAIKADARTKAFLMSALPSAIGWLLPHNSDGACVYLQDNKCSIYEKRPTMCRSFSCIGWVTRILETTTRAERRRDKEFIDTDVWKAGEERIKHARKVSKTDVPRIFPA